jgi:type IV pilus assembly protein PilY1
VVDPSDIMSDTNQFWNLPSSLVDTGVLAQQGKPVATLKGRLRAAEPTGLIHVYASQIRMGAMTFNDNGAKSECGADGQILYDCNITGNRDGARLISPIGKSENHAAALAREINAIQATTWTPLAEGVFNAIGYYTQRDDLRLDARDFPISAAAAPIEYYCQNNNILLLTDGASTADRAAKMKNVITKNFEQGFCDPLHGSSHLKELTLFGKTGDIYDGVLLNGKSRRNINTHIVVTGEPRSTGHAECSPDKLLPLAAKNGGTTLYEADTPDKLADRIRQAFDAIRAGAAAGSAASVISASRTGEGGVYQAVFWPVRVGSDGESINWVGEVHALFVDAYGHLYEDTLGTRELTADSERVNIYYDSDENIQRSMACYGRVTEEGCDGESRDISEVKYLWSANKWLSGLTDSQVLVNRSDDEYRFTKEERRYIFTWNDLDRTGIVRPGEVQPFDENIWDRPGFDKAHMDLGLGVGETERAKEIVRWLRGSDRPGMRNRKLQSRVNGVEEIRTWRLGDVVHSTPTAVSRPAEAYHLLYSDSTYAKFAGHYNNRRHVIYFGGNDGMLHAVNGGFYNERLRKFCTAAKCGNEAVSDLPLGAELWAYVPYNLWPHLKCLTDPDYGHKYYVDQVPRIFDVQIFENMGEDYPNGWGTILVGGMRFGGSKVKGAELSGDANDPRIFTSAYFILDITNPEKPPRLLGEMTQTGTEAEMGFTTGVPTVVPMVVKGEGENVETNWYLVLGSGPTNLQGESTQTGRVAVVDLKALAADENRKPFRIPDALPTAEEQRGRFLLEGHENSFVSDLISVDFELNYLTNAVYFGTVQGSFNASNNWDGGGGLYRLVTEKKDDYTRSQVVSQPHEWRYLLPDPYGFGPPRPNPILLLETDKPITAAPSVGWDRSNYWIYVGSGRLFNRMDRGDFSQFTYYGIKEPRFPEAQCRGAFTWETVGLEGSANSSPGRQGLLRVDQIKVMGHQMADQSMLSCKDGFYDCLSWSDEPASTSFADMRTYIAGESCALGKTGKDGWYRVLDDPGERNLGQATLLGGLLTFTGYVPSTDICQSEGESFLYGLYFQTGTPWHRSVFGDRPIDGTVTCRVSIGIGLALTPNIHVGSGAGAIAYVQTSTGAIVGIEQPDLPFTDHKTGRESWREID